MVHPGEGGDCRADGRATETRKGAGEERSRALVVIPRVMVDGWQLVVLCRRRLK